jgi:hypothetical protein
MKTATTLKTKEAGLDFWQGRETFLFSKEPIKALGPIQLPIKWAQGFKRPRSETEHSPLPSMEFKNKWGYTFTPPYVFMEYTETALSPNY